MSRRRPEGGFGGHSARGVLYTLSAQGGSQALRVLSIVVLARLLSPDDYGLVTMATALVGFVTTIGSLGLSEAVVQREKVTHAQASVLFWLNVALGTVLTGVVAADAPLFAAFYDRDELVGVTLALSSTFFLTGLAVQHQAIMLRRLQFRALAARALVSSVVTTSCSLLLALAGVGYWALVIGQVAGAAATVALVWQAVRWRPGLPRRTTGVRDFLSFGGGVSVFRVLDYASKNVDNILIGRFLGADPLGYYTRAYGLLALPLAQVHGPVGNVVRPTMAALWREPDRYRNYYLTALRGLCYAVMPLVVFLAVAAGPVVTVVLGDRWAPSADVFRWLAVGGVLQTIGYTNGWLYGSSGRAWAMARWALVSRPVLVGSFVAGLPWGITGVAVGYAVAQLVLTPIGIARAGRGTPVALRDVASACWRPAVVAGTVGGLAAVVIPVVAGTSDVVQLLAQGGAAAAGGCLVVAAWRPARKDVLGLARHLRRSATST